MGHPVGGPLRGLAVTLRAELASSREESFQLARRVLRALAAKGFVIRRAKAHEAGEDRQAVEELAEWLSSPRGVDAGPSTQPADRGRSGSDGPTHPTWSEPPAVDAGDLHDWIDAAIRAHDALGQHRPDLARKALEELLEKLGAAVEE